MTQMSGLSDIHHLNYIVWVTRSMKQLEINQQETSVAKEFPKWKVLFFWMKKRLLMVKVVPDGRAGQFQWNWTCGFDNEGEYRRAFFIWQHLFMGSELHDQNLLVRWWQKQICFWSEFQEVVEKWNSCQFGQLLQNAC